MSADIVQGNLEALLIRCGWRSSWYKSRGRHLLLQIWNQGRDGRCGDLSDRVVQEIKHTTHWTKINSARIFSLRTKFLTKQFED